MKKATLSALLLGLAGQASGTIVFSQVAIPGSAVASHSSGYNGGGQDQFPASLGIDGNTGNFTHTADDGSDLTPNWSVDFGADVTFSHIRIHNRDSCCGDRLSDLTVTVDDSGMTEIYNSGVVNPGNAMGSPAQITLNTGSVLTGRTVSIDRSLAILSIGELQLFLEEDVTFAPGTDLTQANIVTMTTNQSTTHPAGPHANGVDGNFNNFTHTDGTDTNPWWYVDFGELMFIEQVDLANRLNCCADRLEDITIEVLDELGNVVLASPLLNPDNAMGFSHPDNIGGLSVDFTALNGGEAVMGSRVRVTRTAGAGEVLSIGEATVIGYSVPEPSSLALAGLALVPLLRRRR